MSCRKCSSGNIKIERKNIKDSSNVTIIITILMKKTEHMRFLILYVLSVQKLLQRLISWYSILNHRKFLYSQLVFSFS